MLWQLSAEPQRYPRCGKPSLPAFGHLADERVNRGRWWRM